MQSPGSQGTRDAPTSEIEEVFSLAADPQLAENSRQGSERKNRAFALGFEELKSQTMQWGSWQASGRTASVPTVYLYDGGNILETMDLNGNFEARYTGTLNADELLAELISGATSYYEQDGINSITSLSSSSGAPTNTYSYDSYGTVTGSTGTIANPFQYTGRELDSETSLYYYRARQYDPRAGRFVSEDPEGFDASTNFYAYVDNDPVNWTDPTGLDKVQVCCRPLRKAKPFLMIWHHCYIKITDSSGPHTWGILPDSQGNQIPVMGDIRNSGGKCKDVPGGSQCGDAEKLS